LLATSFDEESAPVDVRVPVTDRLPPDVSDIRVVVLYHDRVVLLAGEYMSQVRAPAFHSSKPALLAVRVSALI
jgi:hypothetical protein